MKQRKYIHTSMYWLQVIGISTIMSSSVFAAASLNDANLAQDADNLEKITPQVINLVQQDVQQPVDVQKQNQQVVANIHSRENREKNIETGVLSLHELQKKAKPVNQSASSSPTEYIPPELRYIKNTINLGDQEISNVHGTVTIEAGRKY